MNKGFKRIAMITAVAMIVSLVPAMSFAATTKVAKEKITKIEQVTDTSVKIAWSKNTKASGYEVARATTKAGKYAKIKTINRSKTISYINKKLMMGKTYYYKVRAFKNVDGNKVYGKYSKVASMNITYATPKCQITMPDKLNADNTLTFTLANPEKSANLTYGCGVETTIMPKEKIAALLYSEMANATDDTKFDENNVEAFKFVSYKDVATGIVYKSPLELITIAPGQAIEVTVEYIPGSKVALKYNKANDILYAYCQYKDKLYVIGWSAIEGTISSVVSPN
ncbi:MAG: fibronectin type III domain-containing protein [Anaerovoracaceae bacterium]